METLMIGCPACGATNRVPADKIARGLAPVCGKCRAPLPAGKPQPVTDASFARESRPRRCRCWWMRGPRGAARAT